MDLASFNQTLSAIIASTKFNFPVMAKMIGFVFIIQVINASLGYRLCYLGILPRHPIGLIGIPLCPLLHGSFNHFFSNAIIFFAMANLVALQGPDHFLLITILIITLSGLATWLFARSALHVGASSLIMGYWGYLLVNAYTHPTLMTIALGIICVYYFGGMVSSLIPDSPKESWEGHLFGVLSGIASSIIYPTLLPYLAEDIQKVKPILLSFG